MTCCGQKRAQLFRQPVQPPSKDEMTGTMQRTEPDRPPRLLEYLGNESVVLRGAVSGMTYRFQRGDCVEVAYADTFALLAEPGIRFKT